MPILDGNVKRVLCRAFGVEGFPGRPDVERRLWAIAEREMPEAGQGRVEAWTQGLMDLGATVCVRTRPRCAACPVEAYCVARREGRVGSLPTPRPARATGTRTAEWVLVRAGESVLLERRPASGLWGGLWSLPEPVAPVAAPDAAAARGADPDADPRRLDAPAVAGWVGERLGLAPLAEPQVLGEVRHAFTHFRLRARVWRLAVDPAAAAAPVAGHAWLALADADDAPLPRPVKALLTGLLPG